MLRLQLLAHLYAKTDAASLAALRRELLRPTYTAVETAAGAAAGTAVVAGDADASVPRQAHRWWRACAPAHCISVVKCDMVCPSKTRGHL